MEREWGKTFRPNRDDVWVCTLSEAKSLRVWVWWRFLWLFRIYSDFFTVKIHMFMFTFVTFWWHNSLLHTVQCHFHRQCTVETANQAQNDTIENKNGRKSFLRKVRRFSICLSNIFFFWQTFPHYIFFLLAVCCVVQSLWAREIHSSLAPTSNVAPPKNVWKPFQLRKIPVFSSIKETTAKWRAYSAL